MPCAAEMTNVTRMRDQEVTISSVSSSDMVNEAVTRVVVVGISYGGSNNDASLLTVM